MHQSSAWSRLASPIFLSALSASVLTACGGDGNSVGPSIDTSSTRGTLVANPPNLVPIPQTDGMALPRLEPAAFKALLEAAKPGTTQVTGEPKCAVSIYYYKYLTVGGANESTTATGAIMVPSGTATGCSGPHPVVLYAHGTGFEKSYNMVNIRENKEASLVAAMFAAQGYIVVAPNYTGYDVSSLSYHPFLNAEAQSNDSVDALRAARKAFASIGAQDSGKLLLSGYSEGGYVTLATQRAMQTTYASEFKVSAVAAMSGPYALALFSDAVFAGRPNAAGTLFLPLLTTGWQKAYGNIYTSPSDIYEAPYAAGIETVLPGMTSLDDIYASGKLPKTATFAVDSLPGPFSPAFAGFFGSGNLIKSSYRSSYLADALANPCGANPVDPLNCAPANGFRKASVKNDLRTFVPNVPVMLCGGSGDPTVFFANTQATAGYFQAKGMPAAALTVVDIDSAPTSASDPFATAKGGFAQTKAAAIATAVKAGLNPAAEVGATYHGTLLPPFCTAAARGFFQQVVPQ